METTPMLFATPDIVFLNIPKPMALPTLVLNSKNNYVPHMIQHAPPPSISLYFALRQLHYNEGSEMLSVFQQLAPPTKKEQTTPIKMIGLSYLFPERVIPSNVLQQDANLYYAIVVVPEKFVVPVEKVGLLTHVRLQRTTDPKVEQQQIAEQEMYKQQESNIIDFQPL